MASTPLTAAIADLTRPGLGHDPARLLAQHRRLLAPHDNITVLAFAQGVAAARDRAGAQLSYPPAVSR